MAKKFNNKSKSTNKKGGNQAMIKDRKSKDQKQQHKAIGSERSHRPDKSSNVSDPKTYVNSLSGSKNDPSWYLKNPRLVEDASHISWFNQLGAKLDLGTQNIPQIKSVPGLCIFDSVTCPGYAHDGEDAVNIAALAIYEYVRSALNKPNPDYEPADIMCYLLACDDIYAQYSNILRLFGIAQTFSGENLYMPTVLFNALCNNNPTAYSSAIANLANPRAQMNTYIAKAAQFLFYPSDFTITNRHSWLYLNLFKDHDSFKPQIYAYRKSNFWEFDETTEETGTSLRYVDNQATSLDEYIWRFSRSIEKLRTSDLVRVLVSDLRQVFNDHNVLNMAYIDERFSVEPVYDVEALKQIENMITVPEWDKFTAKHVTQSVDDGTVQYHPLIAEADVTPEVINFAQEARILNLHDGDNSPAMIAEITRCCPTAFPDATQTDGFVLCPAADFCTGYQMYVGLDMTADGAIIDGRSHLHQGDFDPSPKFAAWQAFDWAPIIYYSFDSEGGKYGGYQFVEWDNYTIVGNGDDYNSVIRRLNTACSLSTWSIPEWGLWTPQ